MGQSRCFHNDLEEALSEGQEYESEERQAEQAGIDPSHHEKRLTPDASTQRSREGGIPKKISLLCVTLCLTFISVLGTLARLELQALTIYAAAPVAIPEMWANVGGSLRTGYLSEERMLF